MTRRGRYKKGERATPPPPPPPPETRSYRERLIAESTLKAQAAKEILAKQAENLIAESDRLTALAARGDMHSDEARSLPAVVSNLRRVLESLGVTEAKIDPEGDEGFA